MDESLAIQTRNALWSNNPLIPHWVDFDTVGLDRFFTKPEIAHYCHASLVSHMQADGADVEGYRFIEPGAGSGAFYDLLPNGRRTGIDLVAMRSDFLEMDFLEWRPDKPSRIAVIGNPPFGYRAWLALTFMNHAATFADYVGMILPMAFQSDGKGSPKKRVDGLRLMHSETLPHGSFVMPDGKPAKINALWQIWQRGVNNQRPNKRCDSWLDLFTVDMRKERLCGQARMDEADWFLQRTFYGDDMPKLVPDFSLVRYVCGYGVVLKREKQTLTQLLNATDWTRYSNLATHNCRHISMYHIREAVTDAGYTDA
ncbi:MAG: hypothetical protein OXE81_00610 [Gammaproteobacteria bacterium]|nr:hypothetical protein [Gammaproteobacteria bacterium]